MSSEVTLSSRLSQGALGLEQSLLYGLGLAQALKCAHEKRKFLGDLHPDRILLDNTGVRLADVAADATPTPFSSPEQLAGGTPDARSDVFAFGAILMAMLSGQPNASPYGGDLANLNGASSDVKRLVARCLAADPAARWQRASALVIELKLAVARLYRTQHEQDLRQQLTAIRSGIGSLGEQLSHQDAAHSEFSSEVRARLDEARRRLEEQGAKSAQTASGLKEVQHRVVSLEKTIAAQAGAIECVESAITQTDEVLEHFVDVFNTLRYEVRDAKAEEHTQE
jgi:serine/threonine protein kinase